MVVGALIALAVLAIPAATAGVGMIDQQPQAGCALLWAGLITITAVECVLLLMLLL
jgi:hypothetical protein